MSVPDLIGIEVEIISKEKRELENIRHLIMTNYQKGAISLALTRKGMEELGVFDLVVQCLNDLKEQAQSGL